MPDWATLMMWLKDATAVRRSWGVESLGWGGVGGDVLLSEERGSVSSGWSEVGGEHDLEDAFDEHC